MTTYKPNGCWWEWWFKFVLLKDRLKKLKWFNPKKLDSLYKSIETRACNPHDEAFEKWGNFLDFYKANLVFIEEVLAILHWTSVGSRIVIFTILFFGLNIGWIRYFNWKI